MNRLFFSTLLLLNSACGGASEPLDGAIADAQGTDAAHLDAPGLDAPGLDAPGLDAPSEIDAPSAADVPTLDASTSLECSYLDTLDRTCTTDADCAVGIHQTDCCGNTILIGYRSSELMTYQRGESACQASYAICGCPAMAPVTDSGEMTTDLSAVQTACVSRGPRNVCLTYVTMRPAAGR